MKTLRTKGLSWATPFVMSAAVMFAVLTAGCDTSQIDSLLPESESAVDTSTSSDANKQDGAGNTGQDDTTDTTDVTDGTAGTYDVMPSPAVIEKAALPAEVAKWEANMITYGKKWGSFIGNSANSGTERRQATYYDAAWIFQQIAQYTGQSEPWLGYAQAAKKVYRDGYLVPNNFKVPGYWRFSHGLGGDFRLGGDTTMEQIRKIRDNPAFSDPDTNSWAYNFYHAKYAREIAYALQAHMVAEKAGDARRETRVQLLVDMAANHLRQWQQADYTNPSSADLNFLSPFMFALTSHALIEFYEWEVANGRNPDAYLADIPGKLASFANWMYNKAVIRSGTGAGKRLWCANVGGTSGAWNDRGGTGYGAFYYKDTDGGSGVSPDLNLLIAPVYAWTYKMTGDPALRAAADELFASGASLAAVNWNGKIFNQNYRWSINYVKWRMEGDQKWVRE